MELYLNTNRAFAEDFKIVGLLERTWAFSSHAAILEV